MKRGDPVRLVGAVTREEVVGQDRSDVAIEPNRRLERHCRLPGRLSTASMERQGRQQGDGEREDRQTCPRGVPTRHRSNTMDVGERYEQYRNGGTALPRPQR